MLKFFARCKNLGKKCVSAMLSLTLAAGMVPLGSQNSVVEAELPAQITIPYYYHATVDELKDPEKFNRGFVPPGEKWHIIKIGNFNGFILGWDTAPNSGLPGLVLFLAEKFLADATEYSNNGINNISGVPYVPSYGDYPDGAPDIVAINHWGASKIRALGQALYEGNEVFKETDKTLLLPSKIKTKDLKNGKDYTTTDMLYALSYDLEEEKRTAGEGDDLTLAYDISYVDHQSWLRTPCDRIYHDNMIYASYYGGKIYYCFAYEINSSGVIFNTYCTSFAAKINLDNVLFASKARATSGEKISQFSIYDNTPPFLLRLDGREELAGTTIALDNTRVTYSAPAGSRLMFILSDASGNTYDFAYNVDEDTNNGNFNLTDYIGAVPRGVDLAVKCWVEKNFGDSETVFLSTEAQDYSITFPIPPKAANFTFSPPENLTYDGQQKKATVNVKDGITGMGNITLKYYDSNGTQLPNAPTDIGRYTVKISVSEGTKYSAINDLTDNSWSFTIRKITPTANDFTFNLPVNLDYNGQPKEASVKVKSGVIGMGAVTVKYYKINADDTETSLESPPSHVGRYRVKFDVADGSEYGAAKDLPAIF